MEFKELELLSYAFYAVMTLAHFPNAIKNVKDGYVWLINEFFKIKNKPKATNIYKANKCPNETSTLRSSKTEGSPNKDLVTSNDSLQNPRMKVKNALLLFLSSILFLIMGFAIGGVNKSTIVFLFVSYTIMIASAIYWIMGKTFNAIAIAFEQVANNINNTVT